MEISSIAPVYIIKFSVLQCRKNDITFYLWFLL